MTTKKTITIFMAIIVAIISTVITLTFYKQLSIAKRKEGVQFKIAQSINETNKVVNEEEQLHKRSALTDIIAEVRSKRRDLYDAIRIEYGNFTDLIFNSAFLYSQVITTPKNSGGVNGTSLSWMRLKRRMKIKIIQAHLADDDNDDPIEFVWITGGNSVAAGHGNLLNQSYSAVLEYSARDAFRSAGLNFHAKNFGMSAGMSGPEVAMCMESLFGLNVDVLVWDYALTDGRRGGYLYSFFTQRAGLHRSKPTIIDFGHHPPVNQRLEASGMGAFQFSKEDVLPLIPDSNDSIDVQTLPPGLRYFMCNGHMENFDICPEFKYDTKQVCTRFPDQVTWHPGWKPNLLIGRLLSVFMVDTLLSALEELHEGDELTTGQLELTDTTPSMTQEYMQYLQQLDTADKKNFLSSPLPDDKGFFSVMGEDFSLLQQFPGICHTATLPAQARFDGIVTQTLNKGTYNFAGQVLNYDEGIDSKYFLDPKLPDNDNKTSILVSERTQRYNFCSGPYHIDFKDYFLVHKAQG